MYYGIKKYWRRHNAIYNEISCNFISEREGSDYEITYSESLMPQEFCKADRISALNIAEVFASLHKKKKNPDIFIDSVINFISEYGMMGIYKKSGSVGCSPIEGYFDWDKETEKMFNLFEKLDYLEKYPPIDEPFKVNVLSDDIPDEAYNINYNAEYIKELEKSSNVILIEINSIINEHLTNVGPYLMQDISQNRYFSRPMMETFNLLGAMYFAIFQALQSIMFCICDECGYPFIASSRKKIINLCNNCVSIKRIKRRNANRHSNPLVKFRDNLKQRIRDYEKRSMTFPIYKIDILKDWFSEFEKELSYIKSKGSDNKDIIWIREKDQEFKKLVNRIKKEGK